MTLPWNIKTWPIMEDGSSAREYACDGCGCIWWGPSPSRPDCPVCGRPDPHACDTFGWAYTCDNPEWQLGFFKTFHRNYHIGVAELTPDYSVYRARLPLKVCYAQWVGLGEPQWNLRA